MNRKELGRVFLVYSVITAGVTVIPFTRLYGRAVVLLLIVSLFVFSILHAQAGSGPTMSMEGGGGEGGSDFIETDATPSRIDLSSSVPGNSQTALTFYLLGVILWSFAALIVVV